jgi:hypothetical protein
VPGTIPTPGRSERVGLGLAGLGKIVTAGGAVAGAVGDNVDGTGLVQLRTATAPTKAWASGRMALMRIQEG